MSADFAMRLTDLRKEKDISQKEAASCLGVSQALLSHYEKGIRECGHDFLIKASNFYDVTADYLLGLSENRHGFNDIYDVTELATDNELKIKTLYRALISLTDKLSSSGDNAENRLKDEILLFVYRFALLSVKYGVSEKDWFGIDVKDGEILSSRVLDKMFSGTRHKEKNPANAYESEPEFLKTVIRCSEELIRERYNKMLNNN